MIIFKILLTARYGTESYMSQPEKSKKHSFIDKKKNKDGVTVTVKLACDKDIVAAAAEYSKSFSESHQSVYQERQESLVILITKEKII